MSISDIKDELSKLKTHNDKDIDIKFKTIHDIMDNNIKNLEKFMDNKVINIFARPWNKLELKLKKLKIKEYFDSLVLDNSFTEKQAEEHYNCLIKNLSIGKKIKVKYNIEKCCIESIDL